MNEAQEPVKGNLKKRSFNSIVYMIPRTGCNPHRSRRTAIKDPEEYNAEPEEEESNM